MNKGLDYALAEAREQIAAMDECLRELEGYGFRWAMFVQQQEADLYGNGGALARAVEKSRKLRGAAHPGGPPRAPSERITQEPIDDPPSDDLRDTGHWAMGEHYR